MYHPLIILFYICNDLFLHVSQLLAFRSLLYASVRFRLKEIGSNGSKKSVVQGLYRRTVFNWGHKSGEQLKQQQSDSFPFHRLVRIVVSLTIQPRDAIG